MKTKKNCIQADKLTSFHNTELADLIKFTNDCRNMRHDIENKCEKYVVCVSETDIRTELHR